MLQVQALVSVLTAVLFCLSSIIEARPSPKRDLFPRLERRSSTPVSLSEYSVPTSDGTTSLPSPTSTLTAMAIGRGTQNYTCSANSSAPLAVGANATLYDATPLLAFLPPGPEAYDILSLIPQYLLNFDLPTITAGNIDIIGHHYFNSAGQPTFDLGDTGFLVAKKVGDIPAPSDASKGTFNQGYGAVDWLSLVDAGTGASRNLGEVYRVDTAGGKAQPACNGLVGGIQVQYAALYWFYS